MKKITILLLSAFLLNSCSTFLEEDDRAGVTNEELYATESGYATLRANAYAGLRTVYNDCPKALLAGTDLYQLPRGMNNNGIYDYVTLYDTNEDVETFYTNCYTALQAVNAAVYYLPGADIDDGLKKQYQAEYDFLKGFYHFILLEEFGGIVINDEYTSGPRLSIPRSSLKDSYDYIIRKMSAASDSEALPQTQKDGQICKDIVNHYLAKVYLTRGWDLGDEKDFETAKTYAAKVFASRGEELTLSFEDLWSARNENNDEILFAVQYDAKSLATKDGGNNQESFFGPYLGGSELGHKYACTHLLPSWALHSWFTENDARYEATFMLTIWEKYYDYYQGKTNPAQNKVTAVYPRVWDKAEAQEMFDEYKVLTGGETNGTFNDITMTDADGNLIPGAKEFVQKWCPEFKDTAPINMVDAKGKNTMKIYPFISHSDDPKVNETYWRSGYNNDFCQPGIKKFDMDQSVIFSQSQSYRDIVLASLSETILLYAEACIGLEDYRTAENYIDKVLARPGNNKGGSAPLTVTLPASKEEALEVYLKESAKELAGQYCGRWPELRRTRMLKHMYYKYNYDYLTGNLGADPIGDKLYRPIPQAAIEVNDALSPADQNPGY